MKPLFETLPIILFFISYKFWDIYTATAVAIIASFIQISWVLFKGKKVDKMMWVSLIIITVLGGATLISKNEVFIKWKPTVVYLAFALTLLISSFFFKKNLIQSLLKEKLALPGHAWKTVNNLWIGFFFFMAIANIFIAYSYSTDTWVDFKVFGGLGLMFVFAAIQGLMIAKYIDLENMTNQATVPAKPAAEDQPNTTN